MNENNIVTTSADIIQTGTMPITENTISTVYSSSEIQSTDITQTGTMLETETTVSQAYSDTQTQVISAATQSDLQSEITTGMTAIQSETKSEKTETVSFSETQAPVITSISLLDEETEHTTASSAVSATVMTQQQITFWEQYNQPILICLLIFVSLICAFLFYKLSVKKESELSARQRDKKRLKDENSKKKVKKSKSSNSNSFKLVKNVKETIPYKKCLENDIWLLADKKYSKVYQIDDINYNLGDENQQEDTVENYCNFLNTLDETIVCQVSVCNNRIDVHEHEKQILIRECNDDYDKYRREYNAKVLRAGLSKGQNAIKKDIFITATIECPDEETAIRRFNSIDITLKNSFDRIGNTQLRPLTNQERVEKLKNFFIDTDYKIPFFSAEQYKKEFEKTYIAPDYFEFKTDYFMFGNYYAKCVFIKDYPNTIGDNVLNELIATNLEIIVTSNILAYDSARARTMVQHQISNVNADMGEREAKAAKQGYFSTTMPVKVKNQIDSYKELYDMITINDERLFHVTTIIMVKTKTYEELTNAVEIISSTLKRQGCTYSEMKWQQEDAMADCLPIGSQRKFQWNRSMPTESIGIFMPFNVKEVQSPNSMYYGLNKLSNNMITFDRILSLINPAGYILGCPGSGKSFSAKRAIVEAYLRYIHSEIIIIDPEREYPAITEMFDGQSIKISTSSKTFINPFDFDKALINDEDYDVIKEKAQLITSFIGCMYTNRSLTPQEISFIDRCVRITYRNSGFFETLDKKDMPILGDFYEVMKNETENVDEKMKQNMLATLEMYVGEGSANYFNHHTNVDIYNRLVSFDIKDLSGVLKTQAMLLVLDNIWNRLSANREKKIPTWIYCDEIHVLFSNDYCLSFFQSLYKRARKYGGVLTGITQNVTDLLRNEACCTMLSNSEFLYLLKQSPADSLKLQDVLHFTDSELFYVNNVGPGEGLMVLGNKDKIPFYDNFPKDTQLYKAMSTSFSETQAILNNNLGKMSPAS